MRRPRLDDGNHKVPNIGDRVERRRAGIAQRGTVHYADELQILVKWDDGSSSSLRVGQNRIRILGPSR
jgi:hypothetical protein